MHFEPGEIYHVYNRGNNKQLLFFNEKNYIYFLNKVKDAWKKYCDFLCYCLMPNHFHFMILANPEGYRNVVIGDKLTHMQNFSKAIGNTLSSYTKVINIKKRFTGNLFQKKTKAKCLSNTEANPGSYFQDYLLTCFHYIHQNPLMANIVNDLRNWQYSSFPDYYDHRNGTLCNKLLAMELLLLSQTDFKYPEIANLNKEMISKKF